MVCKTMKKKVILFDLDGTIMNTKEGITKCAAYALEYFGIKVPDVDKLDFFIGPPLHKSFQEFYGFNEENAEKATAKYRERYKDLGVFECEPYDGMLEVIEKLAGMGYHLGVATSKPEFFAIQIMEKYNLMQYFETVTGSLLDNSRSEKQQVIEECFCRMKVGELYGNQYHKQEVIMVGDRKHDIIGAKQTGIESLGVTFGFAREGELLEAKADYIADTPDEIISIIEGIS